MKVRSVLIANKDELNSINAVIQMLQNLTYGEEALLDEAFQNYEIPTIGCMREGLLYLSELIEVEEKKECQEMF